MTVHTFKSIHNLDSYDLFLEISLMVKSLDIDEPQLPRQQKAPRKYDDVHSARYFYDSTEEYLPTSSYIMKPLIS